MRSREIIDDGTDRTAVEPSFAQFVPISLVRSEGSGSSHLLGNSETAISDRECIGNFDLDKNQSGGKSGTIGKNFMCAQRCTLRSIDYCSSFVVPTPAMTFRAVAVVDRIAAASNPINDQSITRHRVPYVRGYPPPSRFLHRCREAKLALRNRVLGRVSPTSAMPRAGFRFTSVALSTTRLKFGFSLARLLRTGGKAETTFKPTSAREETITRICRL